MAPSVAEAVEADAVASAVRSAAAIDDFHLSQKAKPSASLPPQRNAHTQVLALFDTKMQAWERLDLRSGEHGSAPLAISGHSADRINPLSKGVVVADENSPSARSYVAVFGGHLWPRRSVSGPLYRVADHTAELIPLSSPPPHHQETAHPHLSSTLSILEIDGPHASTRDMQAIRFRRRSGLRPLTEDNEAYASREKRRIARWLTPSIDQESQPCARSNHASSVFGHSLAIFGGKRAKHKQKQKQKQAHVLLNDLHILVWAKDMTRQQLYSSSHGFSWVTPECSGSPPSAREGATMSAATESALVVFGGWIGDEGGGIQARNGDRDEDDGHGE